MLRESSNDLRGRKQTKKRSCPAKPRPRPVNELRGELRALIQANLVCVTGKPDAKMSWARYGDEVVERHHVDVEGWPAPGPDGGVLFSDLSKQRSLRKKPLERVVQAWKLGHTYFRPLSDAEVVERRGRYPTSGSTKGEPSQPKPQRIDAGELRPYMQKGESGRRRKRIRYTKSARLVKDSEEEMD